MPSNPSMISANNEPSTSFKAPETPLVNSKTKRQDIASVTMLTPSSASPKFAAKNQHYINAISSIKRLNKRIRNARAKYSSSNTIQEASSSQTDDEFPSNGEDKDDEEDEAFHDAESLFSKSTNKHNSPNQNSFDFEIADVDNDTKPPYSYATLIGMSILTSESKRLTLAQIYNWISDNFKYYKKGDVGWQNSIRHNLSLNKAFTKSEKSKDGKGHYWQIEPGMEQLFLKSKNPKKSSKKSAAANKKASNKQNNNNNNSNKSNNGDSNNSNNLLVPPKQTYGKPKDYARAYQELTPSSSMIQPDEDDLDELDKANVTDPATDTFSSDNDDFQGDILRNEYSEYNIQKTPRQQIFKIRPQHQHQQQHSQHSDLQLLFLRQRKESHQSKRLYEESDETSSDNDEEVESVLEHEKENSYTKTGNSVTRGNKKHKLQHSSSKNLLDNIPLLEAPASSWSASARGESVMFSNVDLSSHSLASNASKIVVNVDHADDTFAASGRTNTTGSSSSNNNNVPLTSSFNSNLNFDLSPIRRSETGPILEPLTPGNNNNNNNIASQSTANNTPNRMKTPSSASIMRKIWNSPSYLDEFYTSPSHHTRNNVYLSSFNGHESTSTPNTSRFLNNGSHFGSASYSRNASYNINNIPSISNSSLIAASVANGSPKRSSSNNGASSRLGSSFSRLKHSPHHLESSIIGNISTSHNDFFGVDICSVVKRAVESAVEKNDGNTGSVRDEKLTKR